MIFLLPGELTCGREILQPSVSHGGIPDRLLALAWARLANPDAPPGAANPDRVLVVRAFSVCGGPGNI